MGEREEKQLSLIDVFYGLKKMKPGKSITMNLHEGGFELDGKTFTFPTSATELKKALGEPRVVEIEIADSIRKRIAEDYGFTVESFHPIRYYWDDYGIEASAYDQENIGDIVIFFGKSQFPLPTTKCAFLGTVLFDGQPWQEIALKQEYNGAHRFKNSLVHTAIYGNKSKEKNLKVMEWMLKTEASEELKKKIRRNNGVVEEE